MNTKKVPAPWKLTGRGYILLYRFNTEFLVSQASISKSEAENFKGGFGVVMLVDYTSSNVGPYQELLFIPGKFKIGDGSWNQISQIYVSSQESVENGKENWGIPKELAQFNFTTLGKGKEVIEVSREGNQFFQATLQSFGFMFPVHTALMSFPLMQKHHGHYLQTTFTGKGWGRLTKVEELWVDEKYFPNIALKKPLVVIEVRNFKIIFPEAIK